MGTMLKTICSLEHITRHKLADVLTLQNRPCPKDSVPAVNCHRTGFEQILLKGSLPPSLGEVQAQR